jgi:hypothetical protein
MYFFHRFLAMKRCGNHIASFVGNGVKVDIHPVENNLFNKFE